jgi:hypothetical protein
MNTGDYVILFKDTFTEELVRVEATSLTNAQKIVKETLDTPINCTYQIYRLLEQSSDKTSY